MAADDLNVKVRFTVDTSGFKEEVEDAIKKIKVSRGIPIKISQEGSAPPTERQVKVQASKDEKKKEFIDGYEIGKGMADALPALKDNASSKELTQRLSELQVMLKEVGFEKGYAQGTGEPTAGYRGKELGIRERMAEISADIRSTRAQENLTAAQKENIGILGKFGATNKALNKAFTSILIDLHMIRVLGQHSRVVAASFEMISNSIGFVIDMALLPLLPVIIKITLGFIHLGMWINSLGRVWKLIIAGFLGIAAAALTFITGMGALIKLYETYKIVVSFLTGSKVAETVATDGATASVSRFGLVLKGGLIPTIVALVPLFAALAAVLAIFAASKTLDSMEKFVKPEKKKQYETYRTLMETLPGGVGRIFSGSRGKSKNPWSVYGRLFGQIIGDERLMAMAGGGPLRLGQSAVVGEAGPELLVPAAGGFNVIPNRGLRFLAEGTEGGVLGTLKDSISALGNWLSDGVGSIVKPIFKSSIGGMGVQTGVGTTLGDSERAIMSKGFGNLSEISYSGHKNANVLLAAILAALMRGIAEIIAPKPEPEPEPTPTPTPEPTPDTSIIDEILETIDNWWDTTKNGVDEWVKNNLPLNRGDIIDIDKPLGRDDIIDVPTPLITEDDIIEITNKKTIDDIVDLSNKIGVDDLVDIMNPVGINDLVEIPVPLGRDDIVEIPTPLGMGDLIDIPSPVSYSADELFKIEPITAPADSYFLVKEVNKDADYFFSVNGVPVDADDLFKMTPTEGPADKFFILKPAEKTANDLYTVTPIPTSADTFYTIQSIKVDANGVYQINLSQVNASDIFGITKNDKEANELFNVKQSTLDASGIYYIKPTQMEAGSMFTVFPTPKTAEELYPTTPVPTDANKLYTIEKIVTNALHWFTIEVKNVTADLLYTLLPTPKQAGEMFPIAPNNKQANELYNINPDKKFASELFEVSAVPIAATALFTILAVDVFANALFNILPVPKTSGEIYPLTPEGKTSSEIYPLTPEGKFSSEIYPLKPENKNAGEIYPITPTPTTGGNMFTVFPTPKTGNELFTTSPSPKTGNDLVTTTPSPKTGNDLVTTTPSPKTGTDLFSIIKATMGLSDFATIQIFKTAYDTFFNIVPVPKPATDLIMPKTSTVVGAALFSIMASALAAPLLYSVIPANLGAGSFFGIIPASLSADSMIDKNGATTAWNGVNSTAANSFKSNMESKFPGIGSTLASSLSTEFNKIDWKVMTSGFGASLNAGYTTPTTPPVTNPVTTPVTTPPPSPYTEYTTGFVGSWNASGPSGSLTGGGTASTIYTSSANPGKYYTKSASGQYTEVYKSGSSSYSNNYGYSAPPSPGTVSNPVDSANGFNGTATQWNALSYATQQAIRFSGNIYTIDGQQYLNGQTYNPSGGTGGNGDISPPDETQMYNWLATDGSKYYGMSRNEYGDNGTLYTITKEQFETQLNNKPVTPVFSNSSGTGDNINAFPTGLQFPYDASYVSYFNGIHKLVLTTKRLGLNTRERVNVTTTPTTGILSVQTDPFAAGDSSWTPWKTIPLRYVSQLINNSAASPIPGLFKGGSILSAGLALVGERGPEVLSLPTGAKVAPPDKSFLKGFTTEPKVVDKSITYDFSGSTFQVTGRTDQELFDNMMRMMERESRRAR